MTEEEYWEVAHTIEEMHERPDTAWSFFKEELAIVTRRMRTGEVKGTLQEVDHLIAGIMVDAISDWPESQEFRIPGK